MSLELLPAGFTLACFAYLLLPLQRLSTAWRGAVLLGLWLIAYLPASGLPLCAYLRGITDDLAITSLLWMAWAVQQRLRGGAACRVNEQRWQLAVCFSLMGLLLYPATLGLSDWDPYRLGYSPRPLLAAVGAIALCFWFWGNLFGAALLTAATALFLLGAKDSSNYWDYLVDPLLCLYCLLLLMRQTLRILATALRNSRLAAPVPALAEDGD